MPSLKYQICNFLIGIRLASSYFSFNGRATIFQGVDVKSKNIPVLLRNRLISAILQPVLSHNEKIMYSIVLYTIFQE